MPDRLPGESEKVKPFPHNGRPQNSDPPPDVSQAEKQLDRHIEKRVEKQIEKQIEQHIDDQLEEVEALRTSIQAGTAAQIVMAVAIILAICYFGRLPLIVIATSILIAYLLEPLVRIMEKLRIPRFLASMVAILIFSAALWGLTYFFYQRALDFANQLPHYRSRITSVLHKYRENAAKIQRTTESVMNDSQAQTPGQAAPVPVKVEQPSSGPTGWVRDNFGTVSEIVLAVTFVPFLVYFMLTGVDHLRRATVRLFPEDHRNAAYRTLGKMSEMVRSFITGNFYIGLFLSACSITVFAFLHLPYFYFTGVISGFVSVIPYLGVLLALIPPIATGIGSLTASKIVIIGLTVLGGHLFAMNVLYPKLLGKRLQLNPLVVTLSLLIWGWIWGAMGLILAVPITGALKIVCDNVEQLKPFGNWMGE